MAQDLTQDVDKEVTNTLDTVNNEDVDVGTPEQTDQQTEPNDVNDNVNEVVNDVNKGKDTTPVGIKKRFSELTSARRQAERESEALRRELEEIKAQLQSKVPKKTQDDFLTNDEYFRYLAQEEINATRQEEYKKQQALYEQQQQAQQITESWKEKVAQAVTIYDDYNTVVEDAADVELDAYTQEYLLQSPEGAKIVYYLAKNPNKADQLATLSEKQRERELLKLEIRAENDRAKAKASVSNAPAPIKSASKGTNINPNPSNLSDKDWILQRMKQKRGL